MCKSLAEGGQRCAAHTRQRLERAAVNLRTAAEAGEFADFGVARQSWENAAAEYASTPTGREALADQAVAARAASDFDTEALLRSLVERGDRIRATNAQIKASLAAAAITETSLPVEAPRTVAEDENENALHPEDAATWLAMMDRMEARKQAAIDDLARGGADKTPEQRERARHRISEINGDMDQVRDFDAKIASAATDDQQIGYAIFSADQAMESIDVGIKNVQFARALNHPNAAKATFTQASDHLALDTVVGHPRCPGSVALTLLARKNERDSRPQYLDHTGALALGGSPYLGRGGLRRGRDASTETLGEASWRQMRVRAAIDPQYNVAVARFDPNENARDEAMLRLAGTRWDSISTDDTVAVIQHLDKIGSMSPQTREATVQSIRDYMGWCPEKDRERLTTALVNRQRDITRAEQRASDLDISPVGRW